MQLWRVEQPIIHVFVRPKILGMPSVALWLSTGTPVALQTLFLTASTTMSQNLSDHSNDSFQLYDLRVEVICPPNQRVLCGAKPGDHFTLQGEMLHLPPGQGFSIYSLGEYTSQCTFTKGMKRSDTANAPARGLGAVLPLLAAKQRVTDLHDWMTTDAEVACPDPHCKSRLRIVRTGLRTFRHAEVTVVPIPPTNDPEGKR